MRKSNEEFVVEATPVIDLRKHGLSSADPDGSANDGPDNWAPEKTEVYVDDDDDSSSAMLVSSSGEGYPITAFPFVMGRGNECDLVLNGKGVSRKHAEIVFQSGRFVVNDLDSLNGIKVNGYKVNRVILEEGDSVRLGEVALTFSSSGDVEKAAGNAKSVSNTDLGSVDPFGSGGRKWIKPMLVGCAAVVLSGGGYFAMQMLSTPETGGQIISPSPTTAASQYKETAQPPEAVSANTSDVAAATSLPPTANSIAPPPSIAQLTPRVVINSPSEPVEVPEIKEEPVEKVVVKTYKNDAIGKALVRNAEAKYLDGDAEALFKSMTVLENDSRLNADIKKSIKKKHDELARLYSLYAKGKSAYVSDDKNSAFNHWSSFLEKEKAAFGKKRSVYADQVASKVVEVYVAKGNELASKGEHHDAYRLWEKALKLGDSIAAKIAIESVDNKAKQLYRKALRLEYVNSNQAKQIWNEVVELVPPGSEYHVKATSKLAWYDKWGA